MYVQRAIAQSNDSHPRVSADERVLFLLSFCFVISPSPSPRSFHFTCSVA